MGFGSFFSNAVQAVGKLPVVHTVSNAVASAASTVTHIPVLGPILGLTTNIHVIDALNNVLRGVPIDKAALSVLKNTVKDARDIAPYTASIVSSVPAIGPGVGAAMMAGAALAEGKRWDDIAIEAAKGAIPGGVFAQAAFTAAVAAARGQPLDQVALAGLPLDPQTKQAVITSLSIAKDIAQGKPVDKALLNNADGILKSASPLIVKGLQTGAAIGVARNLQDKIGADISSPAAKQVLESLGSNIVDSLPVLQAGIQVVRTPGFQTGFNIATGMMNGTALTEAAFSGMRNSLTGDARKGFDIAAAFHIGKAFPPPKPITPLGKHAGVGGGPIAEQPGVMALPVAMRSTPKITGGIVENLKKDAQITIINPAAIMPGDGAPQGWTNIRAASGQSGWIPVGKFKAVSPPPPSPSQTFAYYTTAGLQGADLSQKVPIVQDLVTNTAGRKGASDAIKAIAAQRADTSSLWQRILRFFGLST